MSRSKKAPAMISPGQQPGSWLLDLDPDKIYTAAKQTLRQNPSILELSRTKDGKMLVAFDPIRRLEAMMTLITEIYIRTLDSDHRDLQLLISYANQAISRQALPLTI